MKLKALTQQEHDQIHDVAVHQVIEDCEQDRAYLRGIAELYVDKLDLYDRLNAICEDDDLLVEVLGFDPFDRVDCPHNIPEMLRHAGNITCEACEKKCNDYTSF